MEENEYLKTLEDMTPKQLREECHLLWVEFESFKDLHVDEVATMRKVFAQKQAEVDHHVAIRNGWK